MRPRALTDAVAGASRILRRDGFGGLARRTVRVLYARSGADELEFPLLPGDLVDSASVPPPGPLRASGGQITIGWVMVPPARGSGGHTTMFRMIQGIEAAGHACVILLYDRYGGRLAKRREVIRAAWPEIRAEVRDVGDGVVGLDALVASSWQTAHVVARHAANVPIRFYLVQDFEPDFYPKGAEYEFAEDTYRFGFYGISAGRWLAEKLRTDYGMTCESFDFGADTRVYQFDPSAPRNGVIFYAKPGVPRRGYRLGMETLARFHDQQPDVPIHLFGDHVTQLPFPAVVHGRITPAEINKLYNTCRVGLGLSFTNVSLVPWEMLASGVVPVVNDAPHNRAVLTSSDVRWASPTAGSLALAMSHAYEHYSTNDAQRAADDIHDFSWDAAAKIVSDTIMRVCQVGHVSSADS